MFYRNDSRGSSDPQLLSWKENQRALSWLSRQSALFSNKKRLLAVTESHIRGMTYVRRHVHYSKVLTGL